MQSFRLMVGALAMAGVLGWVSGCSSENEEPEDTREWVCTEGSGASNCSCVYETPGSRLNPVDACSPDKVCCFYDPDAGGSEVCNCFTLAATLTGVCDLSGYESDPAVEIVPSCPRQ